MRFCRASRMPSMMASRICYEEAAEESNTLNRIEIGNIITIKYYKNRRYSEMNGTVTKIDFLKKKIQIDKELNVNIEDIVNISIL